MDNLNLNVFKEVLGIDPNSKRIRIDPHQFMTANSEDLKELTKNIVEEQVEKDSSENKTVIKFVKIINEMKSLQEEAITENVHLFFPEAVSLDTLEKSINKFFDKAIEIYKKGNPTSKQMYKIMYVMNYGLQDCLNRLNGITQNIQQRMEEIKFFRIQNNIERNTTYGWGDK